MESIKVDGIGEIGVRRGANVKFMSVRIAPGRGVWVNVPFGISLRQAEKFIADKKEWIIANCAKMKTYEKDTGVRLEIGAEIRTKLHVLKISQGNGNKPGYKIEDERIELLIPEGMDYSKIEGIVGQFLLEIYKMECRQYLPQRVKHYAEQFSFQYSSLSFRDNASNWGSCSYDNNISLNIKLMKLPDDVIDYVILHELCHTIEKNHSGRFWELVGRVCPNFAELRRKLKTYNTRI